MSLRYTGAWLQDGAFNPLTAPTPSYTYGLWSFGQNDQGQLALGNITSYSSPKQVGSLTDWSFVAGRFRFCAAVKTDGTLWTWGENTYGQLGQGNTTNRSSPVQVGSLTTWSSTACGSYHVLALKTNGTLWAWGYNNGGQLGQNNTTNLSSPVQIGALTTWKYVYAGNNASWGIKTDNTLWQWGSGADLQLISPGITTSYSSPIQVGLLTNWLSISSSYKSVVAVKTDGTLWTWGRNDEGELGRGNTVNYYSPVQVGALTTWSSAASGYYSTMGVRTDGTLWTWGDNTYGQLGLSTSGGYSTSPNQVGALTNWGTNIGMGNFFTMAIKTNGTLWGWGYNGQGQVGINNTTTYSSPKQIGALATWSKITTLSSSSEALQY